MRERGLDQVQGPAGPAPAPAPSPAAPAASSGSRARSSPSSRRSCSGSPRQPGLLERPSGLAGALEGQRHRRAARPLLRRRLDRGECELASRSQLPERDADQRRPGAVVGRGLVAVGRAAARPRPRRPRPSRCGRARSPPRWRRPGCRDRAGAPAAAPRRRGDGCRARAGRGHRGRRSGPAGGRGRPLDSAAPTSRESLRIARRALGMSSCAHRQMRRMSHKGVHTSSATPADLYRSPPSLMRRRAHPILIGLTALALLGPASGASAAVEKSLWGPDKFPVGHPECPTGPSRLLGLPPLQAARRRRLPVPASLEPRSRQTRPQTRATPTTRPTRWPAFADFAVQQAAANGIQLATMVKSTPRWANGGQGVTTAPNDPQDYANFLFAASKRYPSIKPLDDLGRAQLRLQLPADAAEQPDRPAALRPGPRRGLRGAEGGGQEQHRDRRHDPEQHAQRHRRRTSSGGCGSGPGRRPGPRVWTGGGTTPSRRASPTSP